MDVILVKPVEKLGQEGAMVKVKPGYARNYLLPQGLAVPATAQQRKVLETRQRQQQEKAQRLKAQAEALKRKLEGRSLTLKLSLGEDDKPFGAITTHEVMDALKRDGFELEKHALHLEQPIKSLGIFEVPVRLHPEVTAMLKLWVVKE
jgi:large subunit ribosomal protein L9